MIDRGRAVVTLRPLSADDRAPVHAILTRTGFFTAVEIATALELIDEWLTVGEPSGYLCSVAVDVVTDAVLGYVCVGPAPLTDGTYDLYWIAVDPARQGRGVGRALLTCAEDEVRGRRGRLLLIETSSQEVYRPTVRFYERCGYTLMASLTDYYRPGDDKLVLGKRIAQAG
jgi:ribosomal protein S18 acetylase RimI-like enzyme